MSGDTPALRVAATVIGIAAEVERCGRHIDQQVELAVRGVAGELGKAAGHLMLGVGQFLSDGNTQA
jgi:hypothetical protein